MRKKVLESLYGLSPAMHAQMLVFQGWRCAICGVNFRELSRRRQCVDHDHFFGNVRGILCRECNLLLSMAKESPSILRAAANYLERSSGRVVVPAEKEKVASPLPSDSLPSRPGTGGAYRWLRAAGQAQANGHSEHHPRIK